MAWGSWMPGIACLSGFFWPETRDRRGGERDPKKIIMGSSYYVRIPKKAPRNISFPRLIFSWQIELKKVVCASCMHVKMPGICFYFSWLYGNALYALLNRFGILLFFWEEMSIPSSFAKSVAVLDRSLPKLGSRSKNFVFTSLFAWGGVGGGGGRASVYKRRISSLFFSQDWEKTFVFRYLGLKSQSRRNKKKCSL